MSVIFKIMLLTFHMLICFIVTMVEGNFIKPSTDITNNHESPSEHSIADQVETIYPNVQQLLPTKQENRLKKDPQFLSEQVEVFSKKNQTIQKVPEKVDDNNSRPLKFVSSRPLFVYRNEQKKKQQQNNDVGFYNGGLGYGGLGYGGHANMVLLDVLIYWSNIHSKVAVHSVLIRSTQHLDVDPSLQIVSNDHISDKKILKRQKRVIVFRPLFVYKQQQKEKQQRREKWKAQLHQSKYEQQYYQQYLQNYYNQLASSDGYYEHYNQPNNAYPQQVDPYSNIGAEHFNYWNAENDQYNNYHPPQFQTSGYYYPTPSISTNSPNQYNTLSSNYYYD